MNPAYTKAALSCLAKFCARTKVEELESFSWDGFTELERQTPVLEHMPAGGILQSSAGVALLTLTGASGFNNLTNHIEAARKAQEITIVIRDFIGGQSSAAIELAEIFAERKVVGFVDGFCASVGNSILQGCSIRKATPRSVFLKHALCDACLGTADELRATAASLEASVERHVSLYTRHGIDERLVRAWLTGNRGCYYSATTAKDLGLIDSIEDLGSQLVGE